MGIKRIYQEISSRVGINKNLTDALEASDPGERKGMLIVENDLTNKIVYQDRESIKYDWERHMGELPAAVVAPDN